MARRRSPRPRPQIQASRDAAGVIRRRSPRLHPQTQVSEEGAGVTPRRSPRLHRHIQANVKGAGVIGRRRRRRRGSSPAATASLPDGDDMLREIFLRLPPQPSSLPRASAVCKQWRRIVADPKFHRQFYAHHRKPPLLGVFLRGGKEEGIVFNPILDPPDRIPPRRLSLELPSNRDDHDLLNCHHILSNHDDHDLLSCRHGLVLVKECVSGEVIVCDPITGKQRRVAVPPVFKWDHLWGVVLCAAGDQGHVHGSCHSSPFKVVLLSLFRQDRQSLACVYSSEAGEWGDLILGEGPYYIQNFTAYATLVGNVLYWSFNGNCILEFDLGRQNLAATAGPPITPDFYYGDSQIIHAEDGSVGFAILAHSRFRMWQRNVNCQGVATWVPWKTIEMCNILGLSLQTWEQMTWMGYDEDNDVIFLYVGPNVYSVQLKSMESKIIYETNWISEIHPFTSFYTTGTSIDGGSNPAEMLHGTSDACLV
ncbi:uncharacterized protein [Lolium perenne]|uniref:uncharacterized protein n=1 Tax=Lolium perenne TaxID=4522 RepID=UPI0021F68CBD|nr:uncharacterized protein LOC127340795 [Lolium perenne]